MEFETRIEQFAATAQELATTVQELAREAKLIKSAIAEARQSDGALAHQRAMIVDCLKAGPHSIETLANATGIDKDAIVRVLKLEVEAGSIRHREMNGSAVYWAPLKDESPNQPRAMSARRRSAMERKIDLVARREEEKNEIVRLLMSGDKTTAEIRRCLKGGGSREVGSSCSRLRDHRFIENVASMKGKGKPAKWRVTEHGRNHLARLYGE